jgi:photosystem II stability/assembly factor-like uncharacterized protein
MKYILLILVSLSFYSLAQTQWELLDGPYRAEVHAFIETNDGYLLAGTHPIEIFRTTNEGLTWDSSGTGLPDLIDTPFKVNVLVKDNNGEIYCGSELGVHYSDDNGHNWQDRSYGYQVYTLVINSLGYLYSGGFQTGIYFSSDKGINWQRIDNGSIIEFVRALEILDDDKLIAGTSHGVYYSTDGGVSWNQSTGLIASSYVHCLTINSDTLFAGTTLGPFISTDNGVNWAQRINGIEDYDIAALTSNESGLVYAGTTTGGIFLTTDGGNNWWPVNNGIQSKNIISIYCDGNGRLYCSTYTGETYKSINNGNTWILLYPKFFLSDINKILQDQNNHLFVSSYSSGIMRSEDNGENWEFRNTNLIYPYVISYYLSTSASQFVVGNGWNGTSLFRSTNNGLDWQEMICDTISDLTNMGFSPGGTAFLVSYGKMYRSDDDGESWSSIAENYDFGVAFDFDFPISNKILLGCDAGLYWSSNNGDDWEEFVGFTSAPVYLVHSLDSLKFIVNADFSQLKYTSDFGKSWIDIKNGLPNNFIFTNVYSMASGEIFASLSTNSQNYRIVKTVDYDFYWTPIDGNLPSGTIRSMWLENDNRLLVSLGSEFGVYRTLESVSSIKFENNNKPDGYALFNNYPNPFNPTTKISYEIPERSFVTVKVFDVLGNEVATLVNEEKFTGSYEVDFKPNRLTSGIYFYRLQADSYAETKKMILLK